MKRFILYLFFGTVGIIVPANTIQAQNVGVSINIGNQPAWGPTGYDNAQYYYFPDINSYYDINSKLFHFLSQGVWTAARYLPSAYSNYDLYNIYKVVINQKDPWLYNKKHLSTYKRYRGGYNTKLRQNLIRDVDAQSPYYNSRNNDFEWGNSGNNNNRQKFNNRRSGNDNGQQHRDNNNRQNSNNRKSRNNDQGGENNQRNDGNH